MCSYNVNYFIILNWNNSDYFSAHLYRVNLTLRFKFKKKMCLYINDSKITLHYFLDGSNYQQIKDNN